MRVASPGVSSTLQRGPLGPLHRRLLQRPCPIHAINILAVQLLLLLLVDELQSIS